MSKTGAATADKQALRMSLDTHFKRLAARATPAPYG
jgi:hypothetical protein